MVSVDLLPTAVANALQCSAQQKNGISSLFCTILSFLWLPFTDQRLHGGAND
jgi:hypothetical protein